LRLAEVTTAREVLQQFAALRARLAFPDASLKRYIGDERWHCAVCNVRLAWAGDFTKGPRHLPFKAREGKVYRLPR
jgi:hypothetical protein